MAFCERTVVFGAFDGDGLATSLLDLSEVHLVRWSVVVHSRTREEIVGC